MILIAIGQQPTNSFGAESLTINEIGLSGTPLTPREGSRHATADERNVKQNLLTIDLPSRDSAIAVSVGRGQSNGAANTRQI